MRFASPVPLQLEVFAEVGGARLGVFKELVDGAREENFAFADEVAAVDDGEDLAGVVVGDEDADPFAFEVADHRLDVVDGQGIDVGEGLIEQKQGGLDDEGAGDLKASALSAGEAAGFFLGEGGEVELAEEDLEAVFALLGGDVEGLEDAEDVLFDGEVAEDGGLLGEVAHAHFCTLVDGEVGDLLSVEEDFAGVGLDEADGHVEGGGLTGAVGAEESDDFPFADGEAEAVYDRFAAIDFDEVVGFEQGGRFRGDHFSSGPGKGFAGKPGVDGGEGGVGSERFFLAHELPLSWGKN